MKTSCPPQRFLRRSRWIAPLVCGLILLASLRSSQAQFTMTTNNLYNFYAYNGNDEAVYGTDPDWYGAFGGDEGAVYLDSPPITAGGNIVMPSPWDPQCFASFELDNNPLGSMVLYLNNPGTKPDEMRLDWQAQYTNSSGTAQTLLGFKIYCLGSIGTAGGYWELAGMVSIGSSLGGGTTGVGSLSGSQANLYGPAGAGPWIGGQMSAPGGVFNPDYTVLFSPPVTIANGENFNVYGYYDLIVDPGIIQIQILAIQPPALGIGLSGANVILTWPTNATGYTLQSTTNLAPPAGWSAVSPSPVVINTNYVVTDAIAGTQMFYRLSQ